MFPTAPLEAAQGLGQLGDKWTESAALLVQRCWSSVLSAREMGTVYIGFSVTWGVRRNPHSHFKPAGGVLRLQLRAPGHGFN